MEGTFVAFIPAIVAIVLALLTKQVYVSLFLGIFTGAMLYVGGDVLRALGTVYTVMSEKVGANVPIIVFLVVLGIFVVLMQKSGGSRAYGEWASRKIKSKRGALAATAGLGCLIFVDDYFNCLTVGSVMRPITDKFKVSHSKLAWIIDCTAAPICIIAPISSWAAAVSGELDGDGLVVFMQTIPFNVYAILTIIMVFVFCAMKLDFSKMKKNEVIAETTGDLNAGETDLPTDEDDSIVSNPKGKVRHLVIPVIILIACCIGGMIYSGFFYDWDTGTYGTQLQSANVIEAFSNCDAGSSLAIGSTIALVLVSIYYMITKTVSFKEITGSFTQGFKAMVPAILILTFAWSISGIMGAKGGYLDAKAFVETYMELVPSTVQAFFPAIFFVLACGIAFATGTSWGTFGVLVPVSVTLLGGSGTLVFLTVAATLGGAVFGDHVSPISDTTILSSTGANCNHVDHVKTQLPYAGVIAGITAISYIIAGLLSTFGGLIAGVSMWAVALTMFALFVLIVKFKSKIKEK
ncbi:MAG: Na+/H+ antiporter NhaC family protein [Ruminococcaceae bacterium]|nr:Na+/H+ antiporter NhaC family protein [Oscillospiraceae bacterium]